MSRSTLRRFVVALPILVVATALPIVQSPPTPELHHWAMSLTTATRVRAPGPFGLVGVSWPAGSDPVSGVKVRTSTNGTSWTSWQDLDFDLDDVIARDPSGQRIISTKPTWVGQARWADVRFTPGAPAGAHVHMIDPGRDPVPTLPAAEASVNRPAIVTRAQWGADESLRREPPVYAEPIRMAIIHHTVSSNSYTRAQSAGIVRSIYAYHVQTNGWNDIGYNFLVDRYGQIFEGRAGGVDRGVVGAHAAGFNTNTVGVSVIGTFTSSAPPAAAMTSLKQIVAWKLDLANVDPKAKNTYVSGGSSRWPAGQSVSLNNISAHRDVGQTECPGNAFYSALGSLRDAVAGFGNPKLYSPRLSRSIITPNGDGVADNLSLTGRFSQSVSWTVEVVDYKDTVLSSTSGSGTSMSVPWAGTDATGTPVPQDVYRFRIKARKGNVNVRTVDVPFSVWRYPDGTLFDLNASPDILLLDAGRLRHVASFAGLLSRATAAETVSVPNEVRNLYPSGAEIGFREGTLVRVGQQYWVISDGDRRPATTQTLQSLGYDLTSAISTTLAALAPHPVGPELTVGPHPNGAALKSTDVREAWMLGGVARPFVTSNVRSSYQIRNVDLAGPADAEVQQGLTTPPVGFRDGTLIRTASSPAIYLVTGGLRRHISSGRTFTQMGYKWANVRAVTETELALQPEGPSL